MQRTAPQTFSIPQKRREKSRYTGNAKACGSQQRTAGVML